MLEKIGPESKKEEKKALIEALLFVEHEPLEYAKLRKILNIKQEELTALIAELQEEYEIRQSGLQINEIAGGFQLIAHPRFSLILSKFYGVKNKNKMSKTNLVTLSIVAYKQPVSKGEIEQIRGVDCGRVLQKLLEQDLIQVLGRRDTPGKPLEYGTTKKFLKIFSLKSIQELPRLREIKEMEFGLDSDEDFEEMLEQPEADSGDQDREDND